jgi:putative tryptophan/tyrosine transport system substrate-binding protein
MTACPHWPSTWSAANVDVILAGGDPAAHVAKNATATIPIVFSVPGDPLAAGLVVSFTRPGGKAA